MSREAWLSINCSYYSNDIANIIMLFNKIGWGFVDNKMEYLPVNDNDMFAWQEEPLSLEKLFSIISQKQNNGELIGVILYHNKSDKGIDFLASDTKKINLGLNINRKKINNKYTDISWYIVNIVAELEKCGCLIEYYEFQEY